MQQKVSHEGALFIDHDGFNEQIFGVNEQISGPGQSD
jgi:hypothetical protein